MATVKVEEPYPGFPPEYMIADVTAIQAVTEGRANSEQQKRAMIWILYQAAMYNNFEYRTDGRDHAMCSGRRFVGHQIVKMQSLNVPALIDAEKKKKD